MFKHRMFSIRPIIVKQFKRTIKNAMNISGQANKMIDLVVDDDGVAVMTLQRPPVNNLNLEMLEAFCDCLDKVENNNCKGMIITSAMPTTFVAGLDIMEMYKPDLNRARAFWTAAQETWLKLFGAGYITTAAINGHTPAGGSHLALACEYRVMVEGPFTIGLNAAAVGIMPPSWTMECLCRTVPMRQAELALTSGRMFSVDEALQVGLIDEIAPNKQDAIEKCKKFIKQFDHISPMIRALTKQKLREGPITRLQENRQEDLDFFLDLMRNSTVQANIEIYVKRMKQKSQ